MTASRRHPLIARVIVVTIAGAVIAGGFAIGSRLVPEGPGPATTLVDPSNYGQEGAQATTTLPVQLAGVSGRVTLDGTLQADFVLSAAGSYRFASSREVAAYDADTLTLEIDSQIGTILVTGMPPSGPDAQHGYLLSYLRVGAISWMIEVGQKGGIETGSRISRPTEEWVGTDISATTAMITVARDQATGLPLFVERTSASDSETSTWVVDALTEISADELQATDFTVGIDREAARFVRNRGFRLSTLEEVSGLAGYPVPQPLWMPQGFVLASVAFASEPESDSNLFNPPSKNVVVLTYRNGFDKITVTTRSVASPDIRTEGDELAWSDPYCLGEPCTPMSTETIAGTTYDILAGPLVVTHAWGINGETLITVGGEVTVADIRRILANLGPMA